MKTGTVKRVCDGGFGFIGDPDGPDVFFHNNEVVGKKALIEGDKISFEVGINTKGQNRGKVCAKQIQLLGESGREAEWFDAVMRDDASGIHRLASEGQDVNSIDRDVKLCPRCRGTGSGQGGYSGFDIQVSRRQWVCGECQGKKRVASKLSAIEMAVMHNKLNALGALISLRGRVEKDHLETAALLGHTASVQMLLSAGADPNIHVNMYDDDDYCDEVEYIPIERSNKVTPEIKQLFIEWKAAQVVLSLRIVSHDDCLAKLSFTYASGRDIVPAKEFPVDDPPKRVWEYIATFAEKPIQADGIKMILPDGRHHSLSSAAGAGNLKDFLWPEGLTAD